MANKKNIPGRVKDPKKVAAGKARAAQSVRIEGRFTSNEFFQRVQSDADATGAKDAFQYFLQNEKVYEQMYKAVQTTTKKDLNSAKKYIKEFKGKVYKNNKEVTKGTLINSLTQLNQYLKSEHDIVAFWQNLELTGFEGKLNIKVPSVKEIEQRIEDGEEIADIMEEEGIDVIESEPKSQSQTNKVTHLIKSKRAKRTVCGLTVNKGRHVSTDKNEIDCSRCKAFSK